MDHRQNVSSSSTLDRKIIERNRRNQMKVLYSQLNSLLPQQSSKNTMALTDQLDEATNYIKMTETKIEELKKKRDNLMGVNNNNNETRTSYGGGGGGSSSSAAVELRSPQIEIRDLGTALEVTLITGLDCHFMFNEIIRMIHEEGLEVVNANFSVVDGTVFHMIHSKVGDNEMESSGVARVNERLKNFFL